MRSFWAFLPGIALSIGFLQGQPTFLSGPVEGFTFDPPTQSFRALIGLPGSALFGPALATGFDSGSVAPHKNYGIGLQQGNCLLVSSLDSDQISTTSIAGLSGQPEAITWSADGSIAVLYSRTGAWLQVLRGLPGAPQMDASVDLSPLGGSLTAVASDPQGKRIALAMQGDNGGALLLTDVQSFASVLPLANPTALTFSEDGASLYVLDGNSLQLDVVALSDGSFQTLSLDGLQDPFAIASGRDSQNRQIVYVASRNDQDFRAYDRATQQLLADLPLDFKPTGIVALGRNSFVIAARSKTQSPLWLFTTAPQPAVYFVPAPQPAIGGSE
jgi:hypothetical protein